MFCFDPFSSRPLIMMSIFMFEFGFRFRNRRKKWRITSYGKFALSFPFCHFASLPMKRHSPHCVYVHVSHNFRMNINISFFFVLTKLTWLLYNLDYKFWFTRNISSELIDQNATEKSTSFQ